LIHGGLIKINLILLTLKGLQTNKLKNIINNIKSYLWVLI
jgi:hypothetical protein